MIDGKLMVLYGSASEGPAGITQYSSTLFVSEQAEYWVVSPPVEGRHDLAVSEHSTLEGAIARVTGIVSGTSG